MAYSPMQYEGARRDLDYQYGTDSASNAYGRFVSQQRGNRGLADTTRGYQRGMPSLQSNFGRRGLGGGGISSGVQQGALNRYIGDYQRDWGRQQQDMAQQQQQFDVSDQMRDQWYTNSIADLELQRQRDISAAASNIDALRQYLGGL